MAAIAQTGLPAGEQAIALAVKLDSRGPVLFRQKRYGFNNDFLAYFPLRGSSEGLLFVNHEYPDPFFLHARALYGRFAFDYCEPFADYQPSPHNTFMTRLL